MVCSDRWNEGLPPLEQCMSIKAALLLVVVLVQPMHAQQSDPVAIRRGSQVRVREWAGEPYDVTSVWADSIRAARVRGPALTVSRLDAPTFDVRHSFGKRRGYGAARGLAIGLLAGGAMGFMMGSDDSGMIKFSAADKALILGGLGGVVGTVAGAVFAPIRYSPWMPLTLSQGTARVK
jgi:hypothetical protein